MTVKTDMIQSINPADESIIEEIPITEPKRVRELIGKAKASQPKWHGSGLNRRIEIVRNAAANLKERTDEIARNVTKEEGKPLHESRTEVSNAVDRIRYFCDRAPNVLQNKTIDVNESVTGLVKPEPYGVVAAIKPWNFPINLPIWTIVPALLAGNSVIFKPSELTPVTGRKLIECFPNQLAEDNVINLVQGGGKVGRTLVENDLVDYVSFIGSRQTGEWIYRASSSHIRPITLELGGKDPLIALEDAHLDDVMDGTLHGVFKNCGQVCCGIERCLVHESLYDEFIERLAERVNQLDVGDGFDQETEIGPMIRSTESERVTRQLRQAEDSGATITYGKNLPDREHGYWQTPAFVTNVDRDMDIMNEESFGPVTTVLPFSNDKEAIEEANRLDYGLGASVYSTNPEHASQVASHVQAGSIGINQTVGSIVELPWGGVKKSGIGRMLNEEGIKKFTQSIVERWNPEEFEAVQNSEYQE